MLRIERIRTEVYNHDGTRDVVCDMQVSTAAELPAKDEKLDSIIFKPGCIAQVIQTGVFYTLDADGTWYDTDGETPASVSASLNSTRTLDAPTLTKKLEIEQPEIKSKEIADEPETEPEVTEDER